MKKMFKIMKRIRINIQNYYIWGTLRDAKPRFTMENNPSPRIRPDAMTRIVVSGRLSRLSQYQLMKPPAARAMVNEGALYIPKVVSLIQLTVLRNLPTATAIPPGTYAANFSFSSPPDLNQMRKIVVNENIKAAAEANSGTMDGKPLPVTNRAV
jgi:hypothetical protein